MGEKALILPALQTGSPPFICSQGLLVLMVPAQRSPKAPMETLGLHTKGQVATWRWVTKIFPECPGRPAHVLCHSASSHCIPWTDAPRLQESHLRGSNSPPGRSGLSPGQWCLVHSVVPSPARGRSSRVTTRCPSPRGAKKAPTSPPGPCEHPWALARLSHGSGGSGFGSVHSTPHLPPVRFALPVYLQRNQVPMFQVSASFSAV